MFQFNLLLLTKNIQRRHKRIRILTSGGDCAGLNAAIRAVVYRAMGTYDWEILRIRRSTLGLVTSPPQLMPIEIEKVDALLTAGRQC